MAENTELAIVTVDNIATQDLGAAWCSIKAGGDREKAKRVYNALNNPDYKVADFINKEIAICDILIEMLGIVDEETGVLDRVPRVVLIDDKGKAYQATSKGIFTAVRNLVKCFGEPTWDEPVVVTVKQINVKRGSMLTLAFS